MPFVQYSQEQPLPGAPSGVPAFAPGAVREVSAALAAYLTTNPYFTLVSEGAPEPSGPLSVEPAVTPQEAPPNA